MFHRISGAPVEEIITSVRLTSSSNDSRQFEVLAGMLRALALQSAALPSFHRIYTRSNLSDFPPIYPSQLPDDVCRKVNNALSGEITLP